MDKTYFSIKRVVFLLVLACSVIFNQAHAATYTVTKLNGNANWLSTAGDGSLFRCIEAANNNPGADIINFNLAGTGPFVIDFTQADITVSEAVTINGLSQSGATCSNLQIVFQGLGWTDLLFSNASNCVVRGIVFQGVPVSFTGGSANSVVNCYFDLNAAGNTGVGTSGIHTNIAVSNSPNFILGGVGCANYNVFSGVAGASDGLTDLITISSSNGSQILSNFIGTNLSGTKTSTNNGSGIRITSSNSVTVSNNIIKGMKSHGISIASGNSLNITGNTINTSLTGAGIYTSGTTNSLTISSNKIGVKSDGTVDTGSELGCFKAGIYIQSAALTVLIDDNIVCSNGTEAPGIALPGAEHSGIFFWPVTGTVLSSVTISNNYVGIDKSFTKDGNKFAGIYLLGLDGESNFINITIQSNFCGANGFSAAANIRSHGIALWKVNSATAGNVKIYGNRIGVNDAGLDMGNYGDGIAILTSSGIQIGGTAANQPNYIGFNKGDNNGVNYPVSGGVIISQISSNIQVIGNFIGVAQNGADAGSTDIAGRSKTYGVVVEVNSSNIQIGGTGTTPSAQGNTIKHSDNAGILIQSGASTVSARGNKIECNDNKGIDLNLSAAAANQGNSGYGNITSPAAYKEPVITSQSSGSVTGVGPINATIDIYAVSTTCARNCDLATVPDKQEGATWVGTTTTDGTGAYSRTGLTAASAYVVTATSSDGRTSEFSTCYTPACVTPTPTLGSTRIVCSAGGSATFTVTDGTNQLGNPTTLNWTATGLTVTAGGNGTGSPFNQTITVTIPTVTTQTDYTISVLETAGACSATGTVTLRVQPVPVITGLPASLNLCSPATANLNPTISGGVTPYTYSWSNSNTTAGTLSATNIANPTFTAGSSLTTQTTNLTLTVTGAAPASCSTTATAIPVTVNPTPTVTLPTVSPACELSSVNVTATPTPSGGTYAWTVTNGTFTGTGVTISVTGSDIASTTTANQTSTVSVIYTLNGCPSSSAQTTIRIDNRPTASAINPISNQCNATTVNLSTVDNPAPSFGTGAWSQTDLNTAATITPGSPNRTATVTGLTVAGASSTYQFTWTVSNGACTAASSNVSFINYAPVTANATGTINSCNSTSATLSATPPSPGTGTWSGTGVSFTPNVNDPGATVSGLGAAPSSTTVTWTVNNGSCSANTTVTVNNVQDNNAVVTTADGPLCAGTATTYNIDATAVSSPQSGVWTVKNQPIAANAAIGSTTSNSTGVSGLSIQGTYTFVWTVTNGGICTAKEDEVNIHVYTAVTADASDVLSCNSTSVALSASNPAPATGTWSSTDGGISFTDVNDPGATVSGLGAAPSSTTVTWTVINGPFTLGANTCTASKDITISNSLTATADAGTPPAPVCITSPGTVTLNGNTAGTWSVSNQPSGASAVINTPTQASTTISGLTVAGTYTFQLSISNSCGSDDDDVTVVVSPEATADANDVNLCGLPAVGSIRLNATGAGTWSTAASGVTIDTPTDGATTLSGLASNFSGQLTFVWTVLNGACQATDNAVLTIDAAPSATASPVAARCETNTTPIDIEALSGVGVWTVTSGTGTVADPADGTTTITGVTPGTLTTVTWTVQSQYQICANATASVDIDVQVAPTSDAGSDFATCLSSTTLNANVSSAGTWTVIAGTGTFADDNNPVTVVSGLSNGVNTFVWTVEGDACADAISQVDVTNTTADLTVSVTSDEDTLCVGSSRGASVSVTTSTGSGNYTYTWSDANGVLFTTNNPNATFTPGSGTTTYYVVVGDVNQLGCNSAVASVDIETISDQNLIIPNLMTPNGDDRNDVLFIRDENDKEILPGSYLQVVNRWGEQVFESDDYRNTWKAPNTSDGMYFYYLKAGCGGRVYKGWVHILGNIEP